MFASLAAFGVTSALVVGAGEPAERDREITATEPSGMAIEVLTGPVGVVPLAWANARHPEYDAAPGIEILASYLPIRYLAVGVHGEAWFGRTYMGTLRSFRSGGFLPFNVGGFLEGRLPLIAADADEPASDDILVAGAYVRAGVFSLRSGALFRWTPRWGLTIGVDVGHEFVWNEITIDPRTRNTPEEHSVSLSALAGWRFEI